MYHTAYVSPFTFGPLHLTNYMLSTVTVEPPSYSTPSSLQPVAPYMSAELLTEIITWSPSLSSPLYMNIPHLIRQEVLSTADTRTRTHTHSHDRQ